MDPLLPEDVPCAQVFEAVGKGTVTVTNCASVTNAQRTLAMANAAEAAKNLAGVACAINPNCPNVSSQGVSKLEEDCKDTTLTVTWTGKYKCVA